MPAGGGDGLAGDVQAGGPRAARGEHRGLGAEVALQVQHFPAVQRAEVGPLEVGEPVQRVAGAIQAVERAGHVDRRARVPVRPVGLGIVKPIDVDFAEQARAGLLKVACNTFRILRRKAQVQRGILIAADADDKQP